MRQLLLSILGTLLLAAPAHAKTIPLKVTVACKAVKKGLSVNIRGFKATGRTTDLKKGAIMFVAGGENWSGDELPPYPTKCTAKR